MKKESLHINSHQVHIWCIPSDKPSILLVHGIGVSSEYYVPFMKKLALDFDVHSIDLPGYGKTQKPDKALSIQQLADIVAEYTKKTGKIFTLVGQSMGSQIVAHVAVSSPQLVDRLILIAPTANKDERTLFLQGARLTQDFFSESFTANRVVLRNYLRMGLARYIQTAQMMVNDQLEKTITKINAPILIVTGENDKIAPLRWTSFLAARSPLADVTVVKNAPHLIQFAKPDELAALTRKFVLS